MSNFREDLHFGEKYQRRLLELLDWEQSEMSQGRFKGYDCWVIDKTTGQKVFFEVKADRMAQRTGNVAIEFQCAEKPSGITATEADYWAYFIHGTKEWYKIPTAEIRQRIADGAYTREVKGGDGWRTRMYLFPRCVFEPFRVDYANQNVSDI